MGSGINDAIRGCQVQQVRLENISNNLANAATTGYKKDTLFFDQLSQAQTKTNLAQGNLRHTGNSLDTALLGEGFFKVSTESGIRYTRNGSFHVDFEGKLVTSAGDPVMGESGPIVIDGGNVTIDERGGVAANGEEVDQLAVVIFDEPEGLMKDRANYYTYQGEGNEVRPAKTIVSQGYLEQSNVVVTEEMVKMIETLRRFESYQKVLQTFDEADGKMINEVGKL